MGLDDEKKRLLFFHSSRDAAKSLKIPGSVLENRSRIHVTTDYSDVGIYILSKSTVRIPVDVIDLARQGGAVVVWREAVMDWHLHSPAAASRQELCLSGTTDGNEWDGVSGDSSR